MSAPQAEVNELQEELLELRTEARVLRKRLTEKANECMQCFTAAGVKESQDFDLELQQVLQRRQWNLQEFDNHYAEYKEQMGELEDLYQQIQEVKTELSELSAGQSQASS